MKNIACFIMMLLLFLTMFQEREIVPKVEVEHGCYITFVDERPKKFCEND